MKLLTHTLTYCTGKRVALTLGVFVVLLALVYTYVLFMSVVHVVIRTEIQHDIKEIAAEISRYERSYIASQHQVSEQLATQAGYVEIAEKDFINRTEPHVVLSVLSGSE